MTPGAAPHSARLDFVVESMRLSDVPAVLAIEQASFSSPWPARAYRYELVRNDCSHYFVLRCRRGGHLQEDAPSGRPQDEASPPDGLVGRKGPRGLLDRLGQALRQQPKEEIVGYGGFWTSGYRAHISTLAVAPQWRRRRLGLLLMLHMLDCAIALAMSTATLEVRVSNAVAQDLYRKCGFRRSGLHRGYYRDNGEDALVMTAPSLTSSTFRTHLLTLREELQQHLGHRVVRKR